MSFTKNASDSSNFSRRDGFQTLKESFNDTESAFDHIVANSFIPKRYSKITWELQTLADGTEDVKYLFFWGFGAYASNQVEIFEDPLGKTERTTVNFINKTPTDISGKYFYIYDDAGSVAVWFNLDGVDTPPSIIANRFIEVPINSGDSSSDMALEAKTVINSDSEFTCANLTTYIMIASVSYGNKTNAMDGDSGLSIVVTDGHETINSKYLFLYDGKGNKYYVWWNVNSTGVDPDPDPGIAVPIEVILDVAETSSTIASKTVTEINSKGVFRAKDENEYIIVTNTHEGSSQGIVDGNTGFIIDTIEEGKDKPLVAQLEVFFDEDSFPTGFEVINQEEV